MSSQHTKLTPISELGIYVVWVELSNHKNFWCYLLYGFRVTRCLNHEFLVIFPVPSVTITVISERITFT